MSPDRAPDDWASWTGRRTIREDMATARLLEEYRATLSPHLFDRAAGDLCPPGFHFGLAPAIPLATELADDASEARGIFLPPIPQPRRMWAGGLIESLAPIRIGARVRRTSTIANIRNRMGKSGALCFVSILHEIESDDLLAVRERQDLVFRDAGPVIETSTLPEVPLEGLRWMVTVTPPLLFRFSAFTFNGHRIHYDQPYAISEGYPGLVVHGPMQAALMLNQSSAVLGHVPPRFEYRCRAPLFDGACFDVRSAQEGAGVICRVSRHDGVTTAEGRTHAPET